MAVALLDRTSRGMAATEAGRLLFGYAERIFALELAAETQLSELAGLSSGQLTIGASNTIAAHVLPTVLAKFNARHPDIETTLLVSNSEEVAERLAEERLTLGFIEGPVDPTRFDGDLIGRDNIIAVASAGHPLTRTGTVAAADLADRCAFAREPGSGTRANVDRAYAALGLPFRPALTVGSAEALKNLLLAGGVAWLPRLAVEAELRSGRLVELVVIDLVIERPLTMIRHRGRTPSPAAAAFMALIRRSPAVE